MAARSQVLGPETRVLRDAGQHARSDLLGVMEGEDEVGRPRTRKDTVRARLPLRRPSDTHQGCEYPLSPGARPARHAALKEMSMSSGPASPCSRRSATTRSASA